MIVIYYKLIYSFTHFYIQQHICVVVFVFALHSFFFQKEKNFKNECIKHSKTKAMSRDALTLYVNVYVDTRMPGMRKCNMQLHCITFQLWTNAVLCCFVQRMSFLFFILFFQLNDFFWLLFRFHLFRSSLWCPHREFSYAHLFICFYLTAVQRT